MAYSRISVELSELLTRKESENARSSFWSTHLSDFRLLANNKTSGIRLIGSKSPSFPFSSLYHRYCQRQSYPLLDIDFSSDWYKSALQVGKSQSRSVDFDLLKHVLAFSKVLSCLDLSSLDCCCVIGDGQANFASLALVSGQFNKVISINLPEILLNDWHLLSSLCEDETAVVCSTKDGLSDFFSDPVKRFAMVQASDCDIIDGFPVDLFFNIASMQEMDPNVISNYFRLFKASSAKKTYFYCCNRIEKELPDGQVIRFFEYPWNFGCQVLFDGLCPWYSHYYAPFRKKIFPIPKLFIPFDGPTQHRLVQF